MDITLRNGRPEDGAVLGTICYEAFNKIAGEHNFPPDFDSPEHASGLMELLLSRPDVYSVVAEVDGKIAGSNFLWEGDQVPGVGPITIDPSRQDGAIGRRLMEEVIRHSDERGFPSVRLVQAAYHNRSLALYTKLGFNSVEPLSVMQGPGIKASFPGLEVRPATADDLDAADALCRAVHGISRRNEISGAIAMGTARVVTHNGKVTGYSTVLAFFGHAVAESNRDLTALIADADEFGGPGFLLPTRNGEVMRWCLENGLKIVQPLTLMARGVYQEPRGAFLPSILF